MIARLRALQFTFITLCFGLLLAPLASAQESIPLFSAEYVVERDGRVEVTETITYDFGSANRHGIFRDIPLTHPQPASEWYKDRVIAVSDIAVLRNGAAEPFEVNDFGDELQIKIGDPSRTITGEHVYSISYTVSGALSYYENGAVDFYWNVTGDDWPVVIESARATIGPAEYFGESSACYIGLQGSTAPCSSLTTGPTSTTFEAAAFSSPRSGLTIAQSLDPSQVERLVIEKTKWYFFWVPLLVVGLIALGIWLYRYETAHDEGRAVVAQYEPYPDFLPMYTGVILDGSLDPKDVTAGLLCLAQQGFLTIKKTERKILWLFNVDDYELTLKRPYSEVPTEFHKSILSLLFSVGSVGQTITLSDLRTDQSKQRANHKALQELRHAIQKDLVDRGLWETNTTPILWLAGAVVGLIVAALFSGFGQELGLPSLPEVAYVVWVIGIVVLVVVASVMYRRRTRRGYELKRYLEGFKDFLATTDKDRFSFHNSPRHNPETFMEYLPYAVAFGVEKEWAEVFADITIPNPDWYTSSTGGSFSAAALTSDLGAFSSSFASSSGSSSASSGGGSSGGGAGGGGGGSW